MQTNETVLHAREPGTFLVRYFIIKGFYDAYLLLLQIFAH